MKPSVKPSSLKQPTVTVPMECPCCGALNVRRVQATDWRCESCGCDWDESKRRLPDTYSPN